MFRKNIYYDIKYNILLLGAPNTGKTSFIEHLKGNTRNIYIPTIGIDFYKMDIQDNNSGNNIKCYLWDTGGSDLLKPVIHFYYKKANAIIIIYDVTNRNSFDEVKYWYTYAKQHITDNVPILLVGNKIDAYQNRVVGIDEGKSMAKLLNIDFIEISILNEINLKKNIIEKVVSCILHRYKTSSVSNINKKLLNIFDLTTIYENNCENNNENNDNNYEFIKYTINDGMSKYAINNGKNSEENENKQLITSNNHKQNNRKYIFKNCYCNIL